MFTGIVQTLGKIKRIDGSRLELEAGLNGFRLGDSLAVNGACLTVISIKKKTLAFDVSPETFARTNLGALKAGDRVNLEPPLTPSSPLGGHFVTGHVDAVVRLTQKEPQKDGFVRLRVSLPKAYAKFVAIKGSMAIDGVSLTVTGAGRDFAETVLVPHTLERTTLGFKKPGDPLNFEVDLLARYMERILETK